MALEFLEWEDKPFAFDKDSWETFSMGGSDRSTWLKIEDSDMSFRIRSNASVVSEAEAKSLADARARFFRERDEDRTGRFPKRRPKAWS